MIQLPELPVVPRPTYGHNLLQLFCMNNNKQFKIQGVCRLVKTMITSSKEKERKKKKIRKVKKKWKIILMKCNRYYTGLMIIYCRSLGTR